MGHIFWWAIAGAAYCTGLLTYLVLPDAGELPRVLVWAAPFGAIPFAAYTVMLIRRYWPTGGPIPPVASLVRRPRAAMSAVMVALVLVAGGLVTLAGANRDRFVPPGEPTMIGEEYFVDNEGVLTSVSEPDHAYLVGLGDRRIAGYTLIVFLIAAMALSLASERVLERVAEESPTPEPTPVWPPRPA
jgi:hypothetical protein